MINKLQAPFSRTPAGVLFDLDGTLIDSAPDLAGAVNIMRVRRGMSAMDLAQLRPYASQGARGLLGVGLNVNQEDEIYIALRDEFLDCYEANCTVKTTEFEGVGKLLGVLDVARIPWGVVTNKHERFTSLIVKEFGFDKRAAVIVSGDTTAHAKPHPLPMLYAVERMGLVPEAVIYVGDDERDIQAARAAGYMGAIAASYGYCDSSEIIGWNADATVKSPLEILDTLRL